MTKQAKKAPLLTLIYINELLGVQKSSSNNFVTLRNTRIENTKQHET